MLKRLGNVLEDNDYVADNPLRKLKLPAKAKYVRQPFSQQEINAMWGVCFRTLDPVRDEAVFLLLIDTGMRIGELCSLRLEKLDLEQHELTVMGKGRRERTVPFGDGQKGDGGRVTRALRRYLQARPIGRGADDAYVFLSRERRRLTPAGGYAIVRRIAELAGVVNAYPHRLRHSMATHYLTQYPGDELGLRRIIGHDARDVLADYVHLAQATIAERAGRASLAETLLRGSAPPLRSTARGSAPVHQERRPPRARRREPARPADQRVHDILSQLGADPELRQALLKALGEAAD